MEKSKLNKIIQTINFLEEFAWLLENKKNISLKESSKLLNELIDENLNSNNNFINKQINFSSSNRKNKQILIGCLPELLKNTELFGKTSELLDFAESVLKIKISRSAKRSRNEYIGFIICELSDSNDSELNSFVYAIENIVGNENKLNQIKVAKKQPNFTWNETIKIIGDL